MSWTEAIYLFVLSQPTWVEDNSLLAQQDIRQRCADAIKPLVQALENELAEATRLFEVAHDRIAELEADRKKLVEEQMLVDHEREQARQCIHELELVAQQRGTKLNRRNTVVAILQSMVQLRNARIAELEAQLAATLTTIEAAASDGALCAEGCQP